MEDTKVRLRRVIDDIGEVVRRDGGSLDLGTYDSATGKLEILFHQPQDNGCTSCTIDTATVRMFLEEALRAQELQVTTLEVRNF